jgi:hypothetical protein
MLFNCYTGKTRKEGSAMLRERLGGNNKQYLPITGCVSIDHGNLNLHTDWIKLLI